MRGTPNAGYVTSHKSTTRNAYYLEAQHVEIDYESGNWVWQVRIYRGSNVLYDDHHAGQGDTVPCPADLLAKYAAWAASLAVEWASCDRDGLQPIRPSPWGPRSV
jgi:hypothetical protein